METRLRRADGIASRRAPRSRPRSPGVLYAVLTAAVCVLVGALALTSRTSAPPTIAEFAPQAVQRISEAAQEGAAAGRDERARAQGETDAAPTGRDATAPIDVARARQCVGDPPRQIEDPQSPPCVPYWTGDNGGATSRGVTRDEVRIVVAYYQGHTLAPFFNKRFEFYGRHIRLIGRAVPADAAGQRAAARAAYEQDQAFASTGPGCDVCRIYLDELARLGIVGVQNPAAFPEPYLADHRPYLWTYTMASDRLFATAGNWYCARFAGRNATHAGDPLLQSSPRKAGIILTDADWEGTSADPMNAQLASCGARTDAVIRGTDQSIDAAYYASFMENAMLQMKTAGVTTLTCLCDVIWVGLAMRAATNQAYFPEWLLTDYAANESSGIVRVWAGAAEQMKSMMLLLTHPMDRAFADHPSNWARQESGNSGYPATASDQGYVDAGYWQLLLLASGIQMAGPNLTPRTFEQGLHRTRFPNPPHRIMAGAVGFNDGDHSMTEDTTEVWWSTTAQSPYDDGPGTFCYVDGGARRRLGTFPTNDPFFSGPCHTGA